ncbi:MAG: SDR family oxidoreductase [Pseudomonadota bacterium]
MNAADPSHPSRAPAPAPEDGPPGVLLALGYGYSARALAGRLVAEGWRVIGTTRRAEKAEAIAADGAEPLLWSAEAGPGPALETALAEATHLLASAAPDPAVAATRPASGGDPALAALGAGIAAGARAGTLRWAGYLSTTGVYGDRAGGWVDEDGPLTPGTARGRARVAAEAAWQALAAESGLALHIFRLAGIYGPGRGPFAKVRAGTARRILKPGQVFSRIHVEDIAAALEASIRQPRPGAVYNLCDDEAAPPEDVLAHAAALLGLPPPPAVDFEAAEMSAMARSFYAESKRVSNARAKRELGLMLRFPTYREGLAALLAEEEKAAAG